MIARITMLSKRCLLPIVAGLLLAACVEVPVITQHHALLTSNYPVVEVNGEPIADSYRTELPAGEVTVVAVYRAYRRDYHCRFSWDAVADTRYEITDYDHRFPLTLYRWQKKNRLWARRLEPAEPLDCEAVAAPDAADEPVPAD